MKKETVNTFTGGMNKDLNPLVTPNDILTDALNAQMLTFNGDELSLQTDAGNTKIKAGDDYIKLTEGFYPLGIKEHGGVLYIVSGKKGLDENGNPDTSKDEIEFGSYPAPEFSADKELFGTGATLTHNNIYRSFTINDYDFKSGRRIKFISDSDTSNIKHINNNNLDINRIYHVRLLHQLESGVLDLTDDIWAKFKEHKSLTSDPSSHWLTSETFNYYCPTHYKGKLQLQLILDEPGHFHLTRFSEYIEREDVNSNERPQSINTYSGGLKFNLSWENSEHIYLDSYTITLSFPDGRENINETISVSQDAISSEIILKIPYKKDSSIELYNSLDYTIVPIWAHSDGTIDENELPSDFINKYKIKGSRLLEGRFNEVYFDLTDNRCSGNGSMLYTKAVLRNRDSKLDTSLNPSNDEYIFIYESAEIKSNMKVLGKYKIVNDKPVILGETTQTMINLRNELNAVQAGLYDHLATQFQETVVQLPSGSCSQFTLKFKFNMALGILSPSEITSNYKLQFTQPSVSRIPIPYVTLDGGRTFEIQVDEIEDVIVNFTHHFDEATGSRGTSGGTRSQGVTLKKENLLHNQTYNIAWITSLKSRDIVSYVRDDGSSSGRTPTEVTEFNYNTLDVQNSLLGEHISTYNLFKVNSSGKTMNVMYNSNYQTLYIKMSPGVNPENISGYSVSYPFTVTSGTAVESGEFLNISDYENYVKIGDFSNTDMGFIIVKKQDSCWINKVDIYSQDDNGSNRNGRSSGGSRTANNR